MTSGTAPKAHTADSPPPEGSGLADALRSAGVQRAVVVGLAEDYCVLATALSAAEAGFATTVPLAATAAIDPKRAAEVVATFEKAGGVVIPDGDGWEDRLREWLQ